MITRQAVIAEARSWLGTNWQHQASVKGVACDCIGLLGGVALALGLPGAEAWRDTPEFHNYSRQPDPRILLGGCETLMDPVSRGDLRLADVIVFRFTAEPQHFGIVSKLDPMYIIHALARAKKAGKVVENRVDEVWRSRIVRTYRFRGVA